MFLRHIPESEKKAPEKPRQIDISTRNFSECETFIQNAGRYKTRLMLGGLRLEKGFGCVCVCGFAYGFITLPLKQGSFDWISTWPTHTHVNTQLHNSLPPGVCLIPNEFKERTNLLWGFGKEVRKNTSFQAFCLCGNYAVDFVPSY